MGGTIAVSSSGIAAGGGIRLAIGSASTTETTASATDPNGEFDFSVPRKITITYTGLTGTGRFGVQINNNSSSDANSPLGTASRPYWQAPGDAAGSIVVNFNPSTLTAGTDTLSKAFLGLRSESGVTTMTITSIKIE